MPIKRVSHVFKKSSGEWNVIPDEFIDFTSFVDLKHLIILGNEPSEDENTSTDTVTVFNLRIWKHTIQYDDTRIRNATEFIRQRYPVVLDLSTWFPRLESVQINYLNISELILPSAVMSLTLIWCNLIPIIQTPSKLRCLVLNGCYNALSKIPLPLFIRSIQIYGEHISVLSIYPDLQHLYLDTCKVDKIVNASHLFYLPINGFNLLNCISPYDPFRVNTCYATASFEDPFTKEQNQHRRALYVEGVNTRMDNQKHTEVLVRLRQRAFDRSPSSQVSDVFIDPGVIRQTMILSSNYMRRATEFISRVPEDIGIL